MRISGLQRMKQRAGDNVESPLNSGVWAGDLIGRPYEDCIMKVDQTQPYSDALKFTIRPW